MVSVIHRTTLEFRPRANTPAFPEPEWKHAPDMSAVVGVEPRYWKWDSVAERPIPMTQGERDAADLARVTAQRDTLAAQFQQAESVLRAFMLVALDEFNLHAARVNSILSAIDSGATLAQIKAAVLLVADVPIRTEAQLRTAIRNKLGS